MTRSERVLAGIVIVVAVAAVFPARVARSASTRMQVTALEFGFRLDSGERLRARVRLVTGEVIDFDVPDRDNFMRVAQMLAEGRAHVSAEVEERKVVALDVVIP